MIIFTHMHGINTGTYARVPSLYCFKAFASWSGHEVGLNPQRIPSIRLIASSISIPSTRTATPCVFPEQPPSKATFVTLLSTTSNVMEREHVPVPLHSMSQIIKLQMQPLRVAVLETHRELLSSQKVWILTKQSSVWTEFVADSSLPHVQTSLQKL